MTDRRTTAEYLRDLIKGDPATVEEYTIGHAEAIAEAVEYERTHGPSTFTHTLLELDIETGEMREISTQQIRLDPATGDFTEVQP